MLCSFLGNIPHYRDILSFWNTRKPTLSINWSLIFFETHFFLALSAAYTILEQTMLSRLASTRCDPPALASQASPAWRFDMWQICNHTYCMVNTAQKSYMKISRETSFLTALARRPFLSHSLLWDCQWAWGVHYSICAQGQSLSWLLAYSRREVSPSSSQDEPQAWHTAILW